HCIQSGFIGPRCMESTAFNHAAWNPLHSIGFHFFTLHGIHCIQTRCMESTAFNRDQSDKISRDPLGHAAWNALPSIGMLWAMLHKIHCIQSGCIGPRSMESTAFNQAGWNPLHLIGMHFTMLHGIYCIQSRCMEFTAFNWDQSDKISRDLFVVLNSLSSYD
ncbi:hypothetical protein PSZ91_23205, partial [Shigella sonnei]|nr:hypothetical protein [Shigella sonnei]